MRQINLRPLAAAALFGGLWPIIDVGFVAHWFPSPFLGGWSFFLRHTSTVGGPAEYLAGFVSQVCARRWAGVLAFTLLALAAWAVARGILRRFLPGSRTWPAAVFAAIVLNLASRDLAVLFILPMVAGLAFAWLYMALGERARSARAQATVAGLLLLASIPLYWMLASGFLYACVMCALCEGLVRKRPVLCLAWLACAAAVPYGVSFILFEPDLVSRYLRWMTMPQRDAVTTVLVAVMYAFVPVGALVAVLLGRFGRVGRATPRARYAARVAALAVVALLAVRLVVLRLDTSGWMYADYQREQGRFDGTLASLAASPDDGDQAAFLALYALARNGRLTREMFRYPQHASSDALLLRDTAWDTSPVAADWRSDLYLELGRVNDSQRWAHEALAQEGETPRVLERMALTYILNDNPVAATTFLRALEKVPFQDARAQQYLAALDRDPGMRSDPLVARIRPLMLRKDYVGQYTTEEILQQCLEANPSNGMAFEYLMAHYLLTSDLEGLARVAPRLKDLPVPFPVHVQEALLGYRNQYGSLPPGIDGAAIDTDTETRFARFLSSYMPHQSGPPERAWKALAPEFGATWWFFHLFGRTAAGPTPDFAATFRFDP